MRRLFEFSFTCSLKSEVNGDFGGQIELVGVECQDFEGSYDWHQWTLHTASNTYHVVVKFRLISYWCRALGERANMDKYSKGNFWGWRWESTTWSEDSASTHEMCGGRGKLTDRLLDSYTCMCLSGTFLPITLACQENTEVEPWPRYYPTHTLAKSGGFASHRMEGFSLFGRARCGGIISVLMTRPHLTLA